MVVLGWEGGAAASDCLSHRADRSEVLAVAAERKFDKVKEFQMDVYRKLYGTRRRTWA